MARILAILYIMELSVAQAKDQFSQCLSKAQVGETVIIRKHGKAMAQITGIPEKPSNRIHFGTGRGILVFEKSVSPIGHIPDYAEQERLAKELKVLRVSLRRKAASYNLYKVVTNQGEHRIMAPDAYTAQRIVEEEESGGTSRYF